MSRLVTFFFVFALATFGQGGWKQFGKSLQGYVSRVEINVPLTGSAELGFRNHIYFFNTTDRYGLWLVNGRVMGIIQPTVGRGDLKSPIWWSGYNGWGGQPVSSVFLMCRSVDRDINSERALQKKTKKGQRPEPVACEDPIHAGGTTWMQNPFWWKQADTVFIRETRPGEFTMERRTF
jgi:hypothetical protein